MGYDVVATLCGLAAWTYFLAYGRRRLPLQAHLPAPWGGVELLILVAVFMACLAAAGQLVRGLPPGARAGAEKPSVYVEVAATAAANGLAAFFAVVAAARHGRLGTQALGLRARPFFKYVFFGLVGFLGVLPVMVALTHVVLRLAPLVHYEVKSQDVVKLFNEGPGGVRFALVTFYAVLGAPLVEEVVFRGFLQGYLRRLFLARGTILLTAAAFAFFHRPIHVTLVMFFLGLILGYERERTGSLVPSITTHILFNLHTFVATQLA